MNPSLSSLQDNVRPGGSWWWLGFWFTPGGSPGWSSDSEF